MTDSEQIPARNALPEGETAGPVRWREDGVPVQNVKTDAGFWVEARVD